MNKRIGLTLGIVAFFAILLIPIDPTALSVMARYAAAVTVLMAIFWITQPIPIEATALIPIVAFPLLGILSVLPRHVRRMRTKLSFSSLEDSLLPCPCRGGGCIRELP